MSATREPLSVAGVTAGDGLTRTPEVRGVLDTIVYTPDATAPYTAGATLAVNIVRAAPTGTPAGDWVDPEVVLTGVSLDAGFVRRPRAPVHASDGTVVTGQVDRIELAHEQLEFVVTNGGDDNTGKFLVIYSGRD